MYVNGYKLYLSTLNKKKRKEEEEKENKGMKKDNQSKLNKAMALPLA